jgi:PAS domain S-box-containing protein
MLTLASKVALPCCPGPLHLNQRYILDAELTELPVLVVDDDAVSRHVLVHALAEASLKSVAVSSGSEALDWVRQNSASLVLLDLMMPEPDGYEVLRELRAEMATADVPVVVLTALDNEDEVTRAFQAGADDFLRKPFRTAELVARIRGQLRLRGYVETIARRERDAQVVLELTQALASSLDIHDILQTVVQRVAEVTGVDRCSIVLVPEAGDVGYVVASNDDEQVRDLRLDLEKYPEILKVLDTGNPVIIDNAATDPLFEMLRRESLPHSFASLALLPILHKERPMGVLFLRSRSASHLQPQLIALARTIANATGIALRNARMLQSLRDQTTFNRVARYEAERRLRLTQRYADFFEHAAEGILALDAEGAILFSNPQACALSGFSREDLRGKTLTSLVIESDIQLARDLLASFRIGRYPKGVDMHFLRADDTTCIVNINFSLMNEEKAILCTFRDVTQERAIEEELRNTKGFLERVIDSSVDAIVSADLRGNVLLFNGAAEQAYGFRAEEVVGKVNVEDLYPPGIARKLMMLMRTNDGRLESYRTEVLTKTHERVPVTLSAALIFDGERAVGSVGIFTDLRERIRMESRLVAAQEELKLREKQAFIAELAGAAAHELNQPLTTVMGYAELLKRRLDRESSAYSACEVIVSEAERMAEIVRKIGKITRYETKSYVGHARILDIDKASSDAAADSSPPSPSSKKIP